MRESRKGFTMVDPSWTSTLRHPTIIGTFVGGNTQIKREITPKVVDQSGRPHHTSRVAHFRSTLRKVQNEKNAHF